MERGYSKAREQYCWVIGRNVVMEEQMDAQNGLRLRCMNAGACEKAGGCKNRLLRGEETSPSSLQDG